MPPWLVLARSYTGLKEIPGKLHNPTIVGWLKRFALNIGRWGKSRDETAWCAVLVSHCLEAAGFKSTRDARAKMYRTYGRSSKFETGAIVVIRRRKRKGKNVTGSNRGGFHVAFYEKQNKNFIWLRGGNQKNSVSLAAYSKKNYEICAIRWPTEALR